MTSAIFKPTSQIISAMNRVYGHMTLAVITSMMVSLLVSSSPALMTFFFVGRRGEYSNEWFREFLKKRSLK